MKLLCVGPSNLMSGGINSVVLRLRTEVITRLEIKSNQEPMAILPPEVTQGAVHPGRSSALFFPDRLLTLAWS